MSEHRQNKYSLTQHSGAITFQIQSNLNYTLLNFLIRIISIPNHRTDFKTSPEQFFHILPNITNTKVVLRDLTENPETKLFPLHDELQYSSGRLETLEGQAYSRGMVDVQRELSTLSDSAAFTRILDNSPTVIQSFRQAPSTLRTVN